MKLDSRGIAVELPPSWEAQIRPAVAPTGRTASAAATGGGAAPTGVILHAANFALPAQRGDYGSGAVEKMASPHILCCLLEHDPAEIDLPLFQRVGVPRLTPDLFAPSQMQRTIVGMAGTQQFFQESGRTFCLYVVIGSHRGRSRLAGQADEVIRSLAIAPG